MVTAALFASTQLWAQEWSAAQKEVWKTIESYTQADVDRDTDKFKAYIHPDYLGWWNREPVPSTKTEADKFLEHDHKTTKVLVYTIKPVGIKVHGDFAFAHYHWQRLVKDAEGKETLKRGRWTDILMKEDGKWLLVGDHGGPEHGEVE
jgi:ketosteroid isomerase-like protein